MALEIDRDGVTGLAQLRFLERARRDLVGTQYSANDEWNRRGVRGPGEPRVPFDIDPMSLAVGAAHGRGRDQRSAREVGCEAARDTKAQQARHALLDQDRSEEHTSELQSHS